jgi:hypothetical protein
MIMLNGFSPSTTSMIFYEGEEDVRSVSPRTVVHTVLAIWQVRRVAPRNGRHAVLKDLPLGGESVRVLLNSRHSRFFSRK